MNKMMTQKNKAAAVVIGLGADYASKIFKYLREEEVEQLTVEIATMKDLKAEVMESVMGEFYNLCLAQKYITEGGIDYAKEILNKAFGIKNADVLIEKIAKMLKFKAFDFLKKVEPKPLASFIQNEHPQTIALVLAHLRVEQASAVFLELPPDIQLEVAERTASMEPAPPEIVREVEMAIERKFSSFISMVPSAVGGVKHMANILNAADRSTEKFILEELSKRSPELAEEIRKRMFVFEDIATLDPTSIQRLLREVESKDLLVALKGTAKEISEVFYENMSTRMSEMMKEDAQYMRGVRMAEVEDAQQRLVAIVRRLEEAGELVISRGRKDEIIV